LAEAREIFPTKDISLIETLVLSATKYSRLIETLVPSAETLLESGILTTLKAKAKATTNGKDPVPERTSTTHRGSEPPLSGTAMTSITARDQKLMSLTTELEAHKNRLKMSECKNNIVRKMSTENILTMNKKLHMNKMYTVINKKSVEYTT
jgi:hypothetical protein